MTIERESRRSDVYLGDGSSTALPFGFKVFLPTEIAVVLNEGGVERTLSHGHGCTVSLNTEQDVQPGGTVRLDTPLPPGSKAVVLSNVRPLQQVDLTNQGGFYPDVLNAVHDRLIMLIQQLMELQARTPQVPATDNVTGKELARQIVELSRSLPGIWQLLTSDEMVRLLAILEQNPQLRPTELSSEVNSEREDVAATSKAVKTAYDKAVSATAAALAADDKAVSAATAALAADGKAEAAKTLADGKADAAHTHTHTQISDWDSVLAAAITGAFPVEKSDNGYLKLPNGLIIQWVQINKNIGGYSGQYQFPIAFPNRCFGALCGNAWTRTANGYVTSLGVNSKSHFSITENNFVNAALGKAAQLFVIAIGY
ncbi:gp53-like domain-containing protein [Neisseria sp. P0009.S008]|uniref:phage tail protein n=1 Tax=unclassified Neisseria TaxID=2623750 RepID=UPI003F8038D5